MSRKPDTRRKTTDRKRKQGLPDSGPAAGPSDFALISDVAALNRRVEEVVDALRVQRGIVGAAIDALEYRLDVHARAINAQVAVSMRPRAVLVPELLLKEVLRSMAAGCTSLMCAVSAFPCEADRVGWKYDAAAMAEAHRQLEEVLPPRPVNAGPPGGGL